MSRIQSQSISDLSSLPQFSWKASYTDQKESVIALQESIFDDPDQAAKSKYRIFEKNEAIEEYNPVFACIESSLYKKSRKKNLWKTRIYYLNGTYLIKKRQEQMAEKNGEYQVSKNWESVVRQNEIITVCNVENMKLERLKTLDSKFGFRLSLNSQWMELFCKSREESEKWFALLKQWCVLTTFSEDFCNLKLLGKGNFARVYSGKICSQAAVLACTNSAPLISNSFQQLHSPKKLVIDKTNRFQINGACAQKSNDFNNESAQPFVRTEMDKAIKTFEKKRFKNVALERLALMKELSIMRQVQHPNVLGCECVYENETHLLIVSELLKGGELLKSISSCDIKDEILCKNLIKQVLSGLSYLSSLNVLHRDVKPDNLLLRRQLINVHKELVDQPDNIVIADFGLADYYDKTGQYMFQRCGTPGFVAPELLADEPYCQKVDVFSAGIMFYILLSGESPFKAETYDQVVLKNYNCEIDFKTKNLDTSLSANCLDLLKQLLERDGKKRISAAQALKHPFFGNDKDKNNNISSGNVTIQQEDRSSCTISLPSRAENQIPQNPPSPASFKGGKGSPKNFTEAIQRTYQMQQAAKAHNEKSYNNPAKNLSTTSTISSPLNQEQITAALHKFQKMSAPTEIKPKLSPDEWDDIEVDEEIPSLIEEGQIPVAEQMKRLALDQLSSANRFKFKEEFL